MLEPRILEVRTKILKKNDELAREMRHQFVDAGVLVSNFVSSPGTGKTALLRETLTRMVNSGDKVAAKAAFQSSVSTIDSIADKDIMHKNTAARHKSRLNAAVKAMA